MPMTITLNGQKKELLYNADLKNIVSQLCQDTSHVIAQLNGEIIKHGQWETRTLNDGDVLELLNLVGGG